MTEETNEFFSEIIDTFYRLIFLDFTSPITNFSPSIGPFQLKIIDKNSGIKGCIITGHCSFIVWTE
jgi:hypothetical protein